MFNLTQTLLVIVIVILTVILSIIGVQIIFILKEIKRSLSRVNTVLDQVETTVSSISHPFRNATGLLEGIKQGSHIIEAIADIISRRRPPEPEYPYQ